VKRRLAPLALLAALSLPQVAQAHLVTSGLGPVYDGVGHFALSPEDSLPVVALALFAGLRGPGQARLLLFVLPIAWLAGGVAVMTSGIGFSPVAQSVATALILLVIGGLLAANLRLSQLQTAAIAIVLGLLRGAADLTGAPATATTVLTLLGICGCVFTIFALAASLTLPLRRLWMIVAAQVTGSWLAAAGLLLAGWIIRYGPAVR
jgi:hypothetical protein